MQSYGFILKQPKFSLLFCSNKKSLPQEAFPTAGIFLLGIIKNDETGILIMQPFHTHTMAS